MKIKQLLFCCLAISVYLPIAQAQLSFQSIELGKSSLADVRAEYKNTVCSKVTDSKDAADMRCTSNRFTYGDVKVSKVIWSITSSIVTTAALCVPQKNIDRLLELVILKYGNHSYCDKEGLETCYWNQPDGSVLKYVLVLKDHCLIFSQAEDKEPLLSRNKAMLEREIKRDQAAMKKM
jgi:hypothetical protein